MEGGLALSLHRKERFTGTATLWWRPSPFIHGTWPNAWGFRFTTPDRVIVVSGDCKPSEKLVEYATGADILVHEVYSQAGYQKKE